LAKLCTALSIRDATSRLSPEPSWISTAVFSGPIQAWHVLLCAERVLIRQVDYRRHADDGNTRRTGGAAVTIGGNVVWLDDQTK
jgi:hypothetical protein